MNLRDQLLSLVAPLSVGDDVIRGARLVDVSVELGLRLRFETAEGPLSVELSALRQDRPRAAATERIAIAYRGGSSALGQRICQALAELVARNETAVLASLAAEASQRSKIRLVEVDRILDPLQGHYGLSPYAGCLIGCRFCYAQSRLDPFRTLVGLPAVPWGSYVDVRANAPTILSKELQRLPPAPIKFCPIVSDPYHAVEARHRVTRRCLEILAEAPAGFTVMLLTRSAAIVEDIDRIAALPDARAGVSLPTIDDDVARHFEPRAASIGERLDVLHRLRRAGIKTHVIVQPLLPGSVEGLADALAEHADSVSLGMLEGVEGAAREFEDPRYAVASSDAWQRQRLDALAHALRSREVPVWAGELPPDLGSST